MTRPLNWNDMNKKDPKLTALHFNECINSQDEDGLAELMAENVAMVESDRVALEGKDAFKNAWIQFFDLCPDYRNHFNRIESRENQVIIIGFSSCSNEALNGPMLWTARVENDLITEWRILPDTDENRKSLGI